MTDDVLILLNAALPYSYRWTRDGRHGQACRIIRRGKRRECLIEFADGHRMLVDSRSLRRNRLDNRNDA